MASMWIGARGSGIMLCASLLLSSPALAERSVELQVKPDRCISLHQNQVCYQTVIFSWVVPGAGNYCLFEKAKGAPLFCWRGMEQASFKYDFQSDRSLDYEIRASDAQKVLARVRVRVASVYNSPRKSVSGWRLF